MAQEPRQHRSAGAEAGRAPQLRDGLPRDCAQNYPGGTRHPGHVPQAPGGGGAPLRWDIIAGPGRQVGHRPIRRRKR
eukprot:982102-Prorocentrum_minimum.AAC.2